MERSGLVRADEAAWERFAELVRTRREELEMTIPTASAVSGLSIDAWGRIENLRGDPHPDGRGYRRRSLNKLCVALHWYIHSIDDILAGGDPTPVEPVGQDDISLWLELARGAASKLDGPGRARALRYLEDLVGEQGDIRGA